MNMIFAVQFGTLMVTIVYLIMASRGDDLRYLATIRSCSPKRYMRLKSACRFNAPLTAIFSLALLVSVPRVFAERTTGPLVAMWLLCISSSFCFFSVRLFLWSIRS